MSRRRAEEHWPLPAYLHALAGACGWTRHITSMAVYHRTWLPLTEGHMSEGDLRVDRGPGDVAKLLAAAPVAAEWRAAREETEAEGHEAKAAELLARASAHRAKAAAIRAEIAVLNSGARGKP